jgi:hypothetical protein
MAVAGVVEHAGIFADHHARQHIRHHRVQSRPRHALARAHAGEMFAVPGNQRLNPLGPNIAVQAVACKRLGVVMRMSTAAMNLFRWRLNNLIAGFGGER